MPIETNSKIGLISKALILCGEQPAQSLAEDRYGVTVGANLFELLYEAELQSNRWRFAMKKGALSRLNLEPLNEYRYCYQLPTDMLLLVGMTYPQPYEIYGTHLYTNATEVEVEYMFKPEISQLPAYFALLLTYCFAKDFISPVTENEARRTAMAVAYARQRAAAMYADAQQRPPRPIVDSPFTQVRG